MKTSKRTTAILLAALLVFSTTVPALAAGDGTGALAEETPEPSAKEEVIYVTLDAAGVCIDDALEALYALTGEHAGDDVIEEVFSKFCVGK